MCAFRTTKLETNTKSNSTGKRDTHYYCTKTYRSLQSTPHQRHNIEKSHTATCTKKNQTKASMSRNPPMFSTITNSTENHYPFISLCDLHAHKQNINTTIGTRTFTTHSNTEPPPATSKQTNQPITGLTLEMDEDKNKSRRSLVICVNKFHSPPHTSRYNHTK